MTQSLSHRASLGKVAKSGKSVHQAGAGLLAYRLRTATLGLALGAASVLPASSAQAEERNRDIVRIEQDIATAGNTGQIESLRGRVWRINFYGQLRADEKVSLEISPAIARQGAEAEQRYQTLRARLAPAFVMREVGQGVFEVTLASPDALLTASGNIIPLKFEFTFLHRQSDVTDVSGFGRSSCTITTQFFATGTSRPLRLGEDPTRVRFAMEPEGVAVFQGFTGPQKDGVVFARQTNLPVKIWLMFDDPEIGPHKYGPVSLAYCADAVAPQAPPTIPAAQPAPAPVVVDSAPPPTQITILPLPERRGFYWGAGGGVGLGILSDYNRAYGARVDGGFAFGAQGRIGYFFNSIVGLYVEPRLSLAVNPDYGAYTFNTSVLAQFNLTRHWMVGFGPAIGLVGSSVTNLPGFAFGFGPTLRGGYDFMLPMRQQDRGPRAISVRVDAQPMYYSYGAQDLTGIYSASGLVTTMMVLVGYEHY